MLILYTLDGKDTAMRYSDILAAIPDISQKMLTVALRNLEAGGLVSRQAYAEIPPRVEYSITERGKSLMPHINSLIEWALANLADILNDRKQYSSNKNH
jgi:DNA-binding HxlR family transcriptional regulator